jgi:hypothetical protein
MKPIQYVQLPTSQPGSGGVGTVIVIAFVACVLIAAFFAGLGLVAGLLRELFRALGLV